LRNQLKALGSKRAPKDYILQEFPPTAAIVSPWAQQLLRKYGALFVFSLITVLIVLGLYRSAHPTPKLASGPPCAWVSASKLASKRSFPQKHPKENPAVSRT
jgi:hypothetical protein